MSEKTLSRSERRRIDSLQKMSVKKQADNLLFLLGKFPLDQTKDQTKEFIDQTKDYATPEIILSFVNVPEIQERLKKQGAQAKQETDRRSKQDHIYDRRSNRKTDG